MVSSAAMSRVDGFCTGRSSPILGMTMRSGSATGHTGSLFSTTLCSVSEPSSGRLESGRFPEDAEPPTCADEHVPSNEQGTKPTESAAESVRKNIMIDAAKNTRKGGFCSFIGKRQNTPKLCFGDEWRVEFEAAVAASLSKKTAGCRPPNTPQLCFGGGRVACFI